ncbi:MAG: peptidoglycan DD-metalloendopeptidase family protein [Rhodospirillales bacterium]|nr:peptidoglycan DD-metalloendopeptidase family protein [Rhodospirillales bacterium]
MQLWRLGLLLAILVLPAAGEPSLFRLPIACTVGETCEIQHYVDRDTGPEAQDYRCGSRTYNGHNGTDIRLPTLAAQRAGVDVLAAADGTVRRVRDGMPDVSTGAGDKASVEGRECGNGIVIAHAGGWETQYCHLAQGSVRVKAGERVSVGTPVGRVGLSGATEFPHLHFTVREGGRIVDPFAHGAVEGTCNGGASLWAPELRAALAYKAGAILNVGFATGAVRMADIEAGMIGRQSLDVQAPALVAFARAIGLSAGDVQHLTLKGPDGVVLAESREAPLDRHKAQIMVFVGRKRPSSAWQRGVYSATYSVRRDGAVVLGRTFSLTL